ncbi:hypothetical protein F3087_40265 [Nocardia colli]|uniref:DUF2694 domain-containing protein n=1 Tax=Nocardia colli TaxID=2545717 RepID=A0A5N0DYX2_9NOCA|nr:hypothetical protein [Nocardia colli]KAA8881903.1 hypothetical protein F3087_40265 [Nocardia colli]
MTEDHPIDRDGSEPGAPDWQAATYEVFNPENTVGVACDREGSVIGLYVTDEARDNGDSWLSAEIVRLARLAHVKSRVGLRVEMERKGTRPYTVDSFDLPTSAAYRAMEEAEFGTHR